MDRAILCWLATVDAQGQPNVSPKELFTHVADDWVVIAQVASPQSVRNIQQQAQVCVSFVDVFVQKGYKIKGRASIIKASDPDFEPKSAKLQQIAGTAFPFRQVLAIQVQQVEPILAPSYQFYPETTEAQQIEQAMKAYGVQPRPATEDQL